MAALVGLQDSSPILLQTPPGLTPGCISTSPCRASVRDLPAAGAGTEPLLIIIILTAPDPHCSLPSAGIQEPTVQPRSPRSQEQPQLRSPSSYRNSCRNAVMSPAAPTQPQTHAPSFSSGTHAAGAAPLQSVTKKKPNKPAAPGANSLAVFLEHQHFLQPAQAASSMQKEGGRTAGLFIALELIICTRLLC